MDTNSIISPAINCCTNNNRNDRNKYIDISPPILGNNCPTAFEKHFKFSVDIAINKNLICARPYTIPLR